MKKVNKDLSQIELKRGDLVVVYKGTGKPFVTDMSENTIIIKGNIKRDKVVAKIFDLIVEYF